MTKHIFPNKDTEDLFWAFVFVRHQAWHNRHIAKLPREDWTHDKIISHARFTNIYRELDRGTQYAIAEVAEREMAEHPGDKSFAIFHLLVYRWFNRITTYEAIRPHLDALLISRGEKYIDVEIALRELQVMGIKLYTGAYIATYCPDLGGDDGIDNAVKVLQAITHIIAELCEIMDDDEKGLLKFITAKLQTLPGFGNFMSYQSTLDMTYNLVYNRGCPLARFANQNSWTQLGPGAVKGLLLLGVKGPTNTTVRAAKELTQSQTNSFDRLGIDFPYISDRQGAPILLTTANIEHSLCEFQKYVRMMEGGHTKTIYHTGDASMWRSKYIVTPYHMCAKIGDTIWQR